MNRDDGEGFHPHPGDPWHPSWTDGSAQDDELDEAPEPRRGEDRAGFLKRLLGDADDRSGEEPGSAEHVYDPIRPRPEDEEDEAGDEPAEPAGDSGGEDDEPTSEFEVGPGDEPVTAEIPAVEPPPELLTDVSFDAESAGSAARWALDREPDGHVSDAAAMFAGELAADTDAADREALAAELSEAAATVAEAEADHGGEVAAEDAGTRARGAEAEAAAALAAELEAAAEGRSDGESEAAGVAGRQIEDGIEAAVDAELAAAMAAEAAVAGSQLEDAAADDAGERWRAHEMGGSDEEAVGETLDAGEELARARDHVARAAEDDAAAAAAGHERELQETSDAAEVLSVAAEVVAAEEAMAAEIERDAFRMGTDDAATSFAVPEVVLDGFEFEAPESPPPEAEDSAPETPNVAAAAPAAAPVAVVVAAAPRRGWRRLLRRRFRGEASPGEPQDSGEPALPSDVMASDNRPPEDDETRDLQLPETPSDEPGEEPHLVPAAPDAGFEGWLDGSDEDAYRDLAEDDAAEEIADWMAFTDGTSEPAAGDTAPPTEELPVSPAAGRRGDEDENDHLPAPPGDDDDEADDEDGEGEDGEGEHGEGEDGEDEAGDEDGDDLDDDDVDDGDDEEDDTSEFLLDELGEAPATAEIPIEEEGPAEEPAGEDSIVPIGTAGPMAADEPEGDDIVELGFDAFEDFAEEDYLSASSTTRDHAGLAAAIEAAESEDTQQVALSASFPGLDSGVVGFEDVVAAEGQYAGSASSPRASDLAVRVGSGLLLVAVFLASLLYRPALIALAVVVFLVAAGEFYTVLMQKGHRPLAIFGFLGVAAASLGTVAWGVIAIPMALAVTSLLILLFYAVVPGRVRPLMNYSITITVAAWAGLGAFAFPIIESERYRTLVLAAVASAAIMDIASYFVGRTLGRNQLAPIVSPKKTWEGLVGGVVVALLIGALLHYFPPFELTSGLLLGAVVAVVAPLGDLAVSVVKRSLRVKDMGSILPGHGGLLDRVDALLFVIPAAWALYSWLDLL